jgi:16S rRNA (cytosine967-C5)-methyltransferase
MRSAIRQEAELRRRADDQPLAVRFSHPEFLLTKWNGVFGREETASLCSWNSQPAPVYGRINTLKITPDEFLRRYPEAEPLATNPAFVLLREIPPRALADGECYIQDPSTAVACELLDPQPGEHVLDACAAPGGKTAYLAQLMRNDGRLLACDRDPDRLEVLRRNMDRVGAAIVHTAICDWTRTHDLVTPAADRFDRILVDAPCSNTGVMRRRVDVRWRLRPDDFTTMPSLQLAILRAVVPLLKPGGVLVYSTCSIEREENEQVVAAITRELPRLRLSEQRSMLPFRDEFDGAFAAKLVLDATPGSS